LGFPQPAFDLPQSGFDLPSFPNTSHVLAGHHVTLQMLIVICAQKAAAPAILAKNAEGHLHKLPTSAKL